jgi:hypothetical protein
MTVFTELLLEVGKNASDMPEYILHHCSVVGDLFFKF